MKIYTKSGDKGSTSLVGGERVGKDDLRVEAYGTVDELTAAIAYLKDCIDGNASDTELLPYSEDLLRVLNTLMTVAAVLAEGEGSAYKLPPVKPAEVEFLEKRIDEISAQLTPIDKFTIPGGHPCVSLAHLCRTICRRAERRAIAASRQYNISSEALVYLNRLSDYLYVLGRKLTGEFHVKENCWVSDI